MMIKRQKTKKIKIGKLYIGGDSLITIQSMTNTQTSDIDATVKQILALQKTGCDIVRVGIPDIQAARAIANIKEKINIPLVADIHYSADFAIEAIKYGADKIRINPGNFPMKKLSNVVAAAKVKKIPIRVGVNAGSLEKGLVQKNHGVTAQALAESALKNVRILEKLNFFDIIISAKAADVLTTIEAYEIIAQKIDYPLHLGITEAGTEFSGGAKSAIGIGSLLLKGIGDTVRVSLSDDPIKEIRIALEILKSLGLRKEGVQIISCPTCARTQIDVINLSKKLEEKSADITKPLTIAVMGCVVNGLGEAEKADLGVVGVEKNALIFKKGILQRTVKKERVFDELWREVRALEKYKTK